MIRKVVLLAVVVMAGNVVVATAADAAKVPPVTGKIGACISGPAIFKAPLTASTPATRATTMTAIDSVSSFACSSSNVTGGKAPINHGSVKSHTKPFDGESYVLDVGFATCGAAPPPTLVAQLRIH